VCVCAVRTQLHSGRC